MREFLTKRHITFCARTCLLLPFQYQSQDSNRQSLAFFALASLSLLSATEGDSSALETIIPSQDRSNYIDWIYSQQSPRGGFAGGPSVKVPTAPVDVPTSHIITSYTSLITLAILQDDFQRLDQTSLLSFIKSCQRKDGSFSPYPVTSTWEERGDPRTTYSALAICYMLGTFEGIDQTQAVSFILRCRNYDGGFGEFIGGGESHGGYTYCCLASLILLSSLPQLPDLDNTLRWLVQRSVPSRSDSSSLFGHQGRVNKDADTCYSFWITAALKLISPLLRAEFTDASQLVEWLLSCQHPKLGGIAKVPEEFPDIYHTYLSIAALALHGQFDLFELDPLLNIKKGVKLPKDMLTS